MAFGSAGGDSATAWRSTDGGDSFNVVQTHTSNPGADNTERYYWGAALDGKMYMQADYFGGDTPLQIFNGSEWTNGSTDWLCTDGAVGRGPSIAVFNNKIICPEKYGIGLSAINTDDSKSRIDIPGNLIGCESSCGQTGDVDPTLKVAGNKLYVLVENESDNNTDGNGVSAHLVRTSDLNNWTKFTGIPETARSFTIDESTSKIYIGTTDSKILVADLPSPDVTAPNVTITSPSADSIINQSSLDVSADATDTESGIAKVEFYIDGELFSTDNQAPYSATWKNQYMDGHWKVSSGSHIFTAMAYDIENNVSTSLPRTVTINPPDINVSVFQTPANAGIFAGAMTVDDEDNVWYVEASPENAEVVALDKLNTQSGVITSYSIPDGHSLGFTIYNTVAFSNGRLWFADCNDDKIKAYVIDTGQIEEHQVNKACQDGYGTVAVTNDGTVYNQSGLGNNTLNKIEPNGGVSEIDLGDYGILAISLDKDKQLILNVAAENELGYETALAHLTSNDQLNIFHSIQSSDAQDLIENGLYSTSIAGSPNGSTWVGSFPDFENPGPIVTNVDSNSNVTRYPNNYGKVSGNLHATSGSSVWFMQNDGVLGKAELGSGEVNYFGGLVTPFPTGFMGMDSDSVRALNEMYLGLYSGSFTVDSKDNVWLMDTVGGRILKISPNESSPTSPSSSDSDSIPDTTEQASPNNGDGNNDGIPDSEQSNVTSLPTTDGTYVTLALPEGTTISATTVDALSTLSTKDIAYSYPLGLVSFTATTTNGATVPIQLFFYTNQQANTFTPRKYNPTTQTYTTLSSLTPTTLTDITIANQHVVKLAYSITDGGTLDQDATANGTIIDPVGLAQATVGVPNTGL